MWNARLHAARGGGGKEVQRSSGPLGTRHPSLRDACWSSSFRIRYAKEEIKKKERKENKKEGKEEQTKETKKFEI